jgi:hypothetical protein
MKNILFFNNGRASLKAGLLLLNLQKKDEVLIPEYVCDSIIQPFDELNLKLVFFKVNEKLFPIWSDVKKKISKKTKAILMIHYFGFPNDVENFLKFKKNNNICLIEDYCHGYKGLYKKKSLGSFGDFSFNSMKKIIPNINSGGVLKINSTELQRNSNKCLENTVVFKISFITHIINKIRFFAKYIILNFFRLNFLRPKYENYYFSKKAINTNFFLGDHDSFKIICNYNYKQAIKKRFKRYKFFENLLINRGIKPLYKLSVNNIFPWYYVGILNAKNQRKYIFDWAWRNNFDCYSWPKFPKQVENYKSNKDLWNKIICFKID